MDEADVTAAPVIGGAEAKGADDEHTSHLWLYLPDLSSQTGWASHQVPERQDRVERDRRPMGFRR